MSTQNNNPTNKAKHDDEDDDRLPGFRFHPTDEELVAFYLRRKVDKKLILSIDQLIKQIDIYKFDPWDLPKINTTADKEGYFFCKRGRKYRNSIRPNRVTGSGFWKATGIDKPVYSIGGEGRRDCIGLKKTLVYYRGSAGKGSKTDWMMHEFRLPTSNDTNTTKVLTNDKATLQEAEVWTICRIFKRNVSYRKYTPDWRDQVLPSAKRHSVQSSKSSTITCSVVESNSQEGYISFEAPAPVVQYHGDYKKPVVNNYYPDHVHQGNNINRFATVEQLSSNTAHIPPSIASSSSFPNAYGNNDPLFSYEHNWDELRSVVDFAFEPPLQ